MQCTNHTFATTEDKTYFWDKMRINCIIVSQNQETEEHFTILESVVFYDWGRSSINIPSK